MGRPLTVTGVWNFVRHANLEQLLAESSDTYRLQSHLVLFALADEGAIFCERHLTGIGRRCSVVA